ncbi:MAG: hypothetical protein M3X11_14145 [Acidobacteriota bacterium]|nr:hypothetical protein [Acidobacteriota bacterium]
MNSTEAATNAQTIQRAVVEKLALLSLDEQKEALAFIEDLASNKTSGARLWKMMQECIKDVPPEAWNEVPTDGALNHDHYLYGSPKRYDEQGNPINYEQMG